jgi:cytidine deaminase
MPERAPTPSRDGDVQDLMRAAVAASEQAYSPYSHIKVGAALLSADGQVFTGCNVENASFGLTICAERAAAVKAISAGARRFTAIAIATSLRDAMMPCGACRQFLLEFGGDVRVIVQGAAGPRVESTLAELLPDAFGPDAFK